jgi:hypothetical protein
MAALGGDLYRTVLGGLYSVFLRGILFVVTDVFPTTVSAGRLFAKRFLGASAILRQLAVITIHWRCLCSARGNGYIGEDLEDLVRAGHPLRGSCA